MHPFAAVLNSIIAQPLLAAGNKGLRIGNRTPVRETPIDINALLMVLAGMLVLVLAVWAFAAWQKRRESRVIDSPRALFRELCAAHGLIRDDRELLYDIAQWYGLSDPVQLFLEPQRLQSAEMHTALDCETEAKELFSRLVAVETPQEPAAPTTAA